jgi:hypothetical protein
VEGSWWKESLVSGKILPTSALALYRTDFVFFEGDNAENAKPILFTVPAIQAFLR